MSPGYQDAFTALKLILTVIENQDARRKQEACLLCFDILLMVDPENVPPPNIIKLIEAMLQKSKEGVKYDPRFHTYIAKFDKLISKPSKQARLKRELKRLEISR